MTLQLRDSSLLDRLARLRRRTRGLSLLYGVGVVLVGVCAILLGATLLDWLLRLPALPRLVMLLAGLAAVGYGVWRFVWRPAIWPIGLSDMAGKVEEQFPQFEDRLRSSHQFLTGGASGTLEQQTVRQASELAGGVDFADVLRPKPAYTAAGVAAGSLAVLALLALLLGPLTGIIAGRLFAPLDDSYQWPKRFALTVEPLPEMVPAGRAIDIRGTLTKGQPDRVTPIVFWQYGDGPVRQMLMSAAAGEPTDFSAAVEARLDAPGQASGPTTLTIWTEAGDDRSAKRTLRVVPRLSLASARAMITPPAYVQQAGARPTDLLAEPAVAAEGSQVELRVAFNKPLAEDVLSTLDAIAVAAAAAPDGEVAAALDWQREDDRTLVARYTAESTRRLTLSAVDADGFRGDATQPLEIVVRADQSPTVQIEEPRRNESRTAEAVVPLVASIDDDYGFESATLLIEKLAPPGNPDSGWTVEVPLLQGDTPAGDVTATRPAGRLEGERFRLAYDWDLSEVAPETLVAGDVLEFAVRVRDNFDLNGRRHDAVTSGRLRITIISQQELNRRAVTKLRDVKDRISAAKRSQDAIARETLDLAERTRGQTELDDADLEALSRLTRQQGAEAAQVARLAESVREVSEMLDENASTAEDLKELAEDVSQALQETAEGPMKAASSKLSETGKAARAPEQADARQAAADEAQQEQRNASEQLGDAIEQMDAISTLRDITDTVQELAERQRELGEQTREALKETLGKTPDELSQEQTGKLAELAEQQEKLAEETQEAISNMQEQAQEMRDSGDEAAAEALEDAAQTARQQQVTSSQQQAARAAKQNRSRQNQQASEQAQLGLEMVLRELKAAEDRKLRELEKKLAELIDQINRLERRQAGHNLDNLFLRGGDALSDAGEEVQADLQQTSGKFIQPADAEHAVLDGSGDPLPLPTPQRLSDGQEQTERNTRDLSKPADDVPEGSDIAAALTKAAGRMERAAVFLRQPELPGAYTPQNEALDALREARLSAEDKQREVAEEREQKQREAIRQRVVRLRDDQLGFIQQPLEASVELAGDKPLNRQQRAAITPLSKTQGEHTERLQEIVQDLTDMGGIAFVYAGQRVEKDMTALGEALAKADVSPASVRRGKSVLRQMDGMLEALTIEEKPDRFDRNSNGGQGGGGEGGGGGGTPVPTEAELKMVKQLQRIVNDATKIADDNQPRDTDELDAISEEQNQLRDLLEQMLLKASQGQNKLPPEPDPATLLPEEVDPGNAEQAIEDRDLEDDLLGLRDDAPAEEPADPPVENGEGAVDEEEAGDEAQPAAQQAPELFKTVGDLMARSRQRLDLKDDPGVVTQTIQAKILDAIDDLIDEARRQQQQQQQQQQQGGGQATGKPEQGDQAGQPGQGAEAGQGAQATSGDSADENATGPDGENANLSGDLEETLAEWGQLTDREREAILESRSDEALREYRQLIDEYYKTLGKERE